ncbi:unnamed protein product [Penicillium pancosmium]
MDSEKDVLGPEVFEATAQGLPDGTTTKDFARVTEEIQSLHDTLSRTEQTADGPTEWIETIRLDVEIEETHFKYLGWLVKNGPKVA